MHIARERVAELGRDTVRILKAGRYQTVDGNLVEIGNLILNAVQGTCSYLPDEPIPSVQSSGRQTDIEVENEMTLAVTHRLAADGLRPVVLNLVSANYPGGGFLSGARAQEESLARNSGLYACLAGHAMCAL